ncbi:MAG TPA: hypothetical protein VLH94_02015 [Spirochaetia bacterium]|nr:hypothetical protein [Spirochaetia bacterium]
MTNTKMTEAQRRYQNSEKGKLSRQKYQASSKAKETRRRYQLKRKARLAEAKQTFEAPKVQVTQEEVKIKVESTSKAKS